MATFDRGVSVGVPCADGTADVAAGGDAVAVPPPHDVAIRATTISARIVARLVEALQPSGLIERPPQNASAYYI